MPIPRRDEIGHDEEGNPVAFDELADRIDPANEGNDL